MEALSDAWVGVVASLAGVLVGGIFAAAGALVRRQWQIKDRSTEAERAQREVLEERETAKADEILRLIVQLETLMFDRHSGRTNLWPSDPADARRARTLLTEIEVAGGYLPKPVRKHVRVMTDLVRDADDIGSSPNGGGGRAMGWRAVHGAKRNLWRFVRGEQVPDDLSEPLASDYGVWREYQDWIEYQHEMWLEQRREERERTQHDRGDDIEDVTPADGGAAEETS